jgi:acyl carrier protein
MALRDELLRLLEASGASLPDHFDDHTSLIESGILDSTALFDLALWIEERVAPGLDLTGFDLAEEWGTLAKLLAFIERHGGTTGPCMP